MKTSVKLQETHLESKKELGATEISSETKAWRRWGYEEKNHREGRRRLQKFYLFSSLPIGLYKERKEKSKKIFDFGEKLPNSLFSSPNLP